VAPRGPFALPLLGHLPWFLPDKLGFLSRCAARYGDVVKMHLGEPTYLLRSAEDIPHVLVDNAANYDKSRHLTRERGKRLSGSGMQTSFGAAHLRQPSSSQGFATRLSTLRYPDGSAMDEQQVRDELLSLTSTGYETIGDALAWTLYLLARHPEIEARVLEELRTMPAAQTPSAGDLSQLNYLRQVLPESMRLYPPTWIFVRMALGRDILPNGAPVEPGDKLYLSPYVVHRHPRYVPKPDRFDPTRFTPHAITVRPRFAHFPFEGGQRLCIGEHFAVLQMMAVLSQVLPRFRFEGSDQPIVPRPAITLRPRGGIPAILRLRRGP
jgi:cytochrome P450